MLCFDFGRVKHLQEPCLARSEESAETVMFSDGPFAQSSK